MAGMTAPRARRVGDRVLCGRVFPTGHRCEQELARTGKLPMEWDGLDETTIMPIAIAVDSFDVPIGDPLPLLPVPDLSSRSDVYWENAWRPRDGVLVKGGRSRAARGFSRTRRTTLFLHDGRQRRTWRAWPIPLRVKCPACDLVMELDES